MFGFVELTILVSTGMVWSLRLGGLVELTVLVSTSVVWSLGLGSLVELTILVSGMSRGGSS